MTSHSLKITRHDDFLPDLCTGQAVFHLVIVGELLAIALTVAGAPANGMNWYRFGLISLMVQWIVLSSAASLCPLRKWLRQQTPEIAGGISYAMVLLVTALFSSLGVLAQAKGQSPNWYIVVNNTIIAAVFAGVVLRYFYLQQQLRNQQQAELQSRIQALQSRIRPHFLFNSMNSIASLIELDPELAERTVEDLADLFRASLSEPGLVTLGKELELCRRFSGIEQLRLGDRLSVKWHISGNPDEVMVPSLLLQPLIENAIYHGIQPLASGGTVDVDIRIAGGDVHLMVSNPLPADQQLSEHGHGNGIALDNMKRRLEAYYGPKARVFIVDQAGRFSVQLQFPTSVDKKSANVRG
jgi:two-component system sensor histidine kinase AlgZ